MIVYFCFANLAMSDNTYIFFNNMIVDYAHKPLVQPFIKQLKTHYK